MKASIDKSQVLRGMSIVITPTEEQKAYIDKCINANRYVYNWAIEQEQIQYQLYELGQEEKSFIPKFDLYKIFGKLRNETEWLKEIPYHVLTNAIDNAVAAYMNFFKNPNDFNKPFFKSKKKSVKTIKFRTDNIFSFFIENNMIRLEGMPGKFVKSKWNSGYTRETTPKIYNATIRIDNLGNYHFSFSIFKDKKNEQYFEERSIPESEVLGIDLNVKKRFVLSNGEYYTGPNLSKQDRRISYLQTKLNNDRSRLKEMERTNPDITPKKSNRMLKRQRLLAKTYKKKYNKIESFIQETTKHIIDMHPKAIVMENLGTRDMLSKHYIAKHVNDACFYRCREVMQYKCEEYNIPFILTPKGYPSSQICSCCGEIREKRFSYYNIFVCPNCGNKMDRDLNAAINLSHLYQVC